MVAEKLKELEAARAKLASLEQSVKDELAQELAGLPAKFGYADAKSFLAAVRAACGEGGKRGGKRGARKGTGKRGGPGRKRRSRAVITDATRAEVKKLVEAGKTGAEIAKAVGISLPSVQNIKKALGLVQSKKGR